MSVEGRRPRHKPDGDSHNGSAADSDSARGSSILSSPTTPQQPGCCGFSFRGVAQLVARLVRDQEAVGSNPVTPTKRTSSLGWGSFLSPEGRGFEQDGAPQRAKNSPAGCLRGRGRIPSPDRKPVTKKISQAYFFLCCLYITYKIGRRNHHNR